jgi:hypothetical protein
MTLRVLTLAALACSLIACGEPSRTQEGSEGAYGASSGPNANDPDAGVAAQDQTPTYDEPQADTGSDFGEHMPSSPGENEPTQATKTP